MVAEDISVLWLGPRRFVILVRIAVFKSSYLLTYLLTRSSVGDDLKLKQASGLSNHTTKRVQ